MVTREPICTGLWVLITRLSACYYGRRRKDYSRTWRVAVTEYILCSGCYCCTTGDFEFSLLVDEAVVIRCWLLDRVKLYPFLFKPEIVWISWRIPSYYTRDYSQSIVKRNVKSFPISPCPLVTDPEENLMIGGAPTIVVTGTLSPNRLLATTL